MKSFLTITLLIASINYCFTQANAPLLTGKVAISIEQGTFECDVTLTDYPQLANNYFIRLNAGMNILNIQGVDTDGEWLLGYRRSLKDTLTIYDEPNSYYFPTNDRKSTFLPKKLRFKYVGKFPVVNDTLEGNYQKSDWRGNIASAYNTLRADGLQSAWFPTIYDIRNDKAYTEVRYDLEIECADCEYLFINGSAPSASTKGRFKSEIPREPLLFLGDYKVEEIGNFFLINTEFNKEESKRFVALNEPILNFYSNYTNIKFTDKINWIQVPTTRKIVGGFAFESYPTFVKCSDNTYSLKKRFTSNYEGYTLQTIAHEYAHYYFGTLGEYHTSDDFLLYEGFAEFLSLKYLKSAGMDDLVEEFIADKLEWVVDEEFQPMAIADIKQPKDLDFDRETYTYDYHTLILWAIDKSIGDKRMRKWIELLLKHEQPLSDFSWYSQTLKEAIGEVELYNQIEKTLLTGENSKSEINSIIR